MENFSPSKLPMALNSRQKLTTDFKNYFFFSTEHKYQLLHVPESSLAKNIPFSKIKNRLPPEICISKVKAEKSESKF